MSASELSQAYASASNGTARSLGNRHLPLERTRYRTDWLGLAIVGRCFAFWCLVILGVSIFLWSNVR
jgi:hypothetical protein